MITQDKKDKIIKWFWIIMAAPFVLLFLMILFVWAFARIPSFEELEHPDSKLATQVIAEGGETLTTFHIENRTYVPYEDLSEHLIHAAVATEDVRFYRHSGIDMRGLVRVAVKTLLLHDSSQGGGSTITQQLAKTLYPRQEVNSRIPGWSKVVMVWTKLKEWITAVKLERDYTKDEIMDMYLNSIFFGSGAYGVKAAAGTFFAKEPRDLTVEESAMLVGMVNKPTRYNPALNPDKALSRRNFVIGQMRKAGFLTRAECDSICSLPILLNYQVQDHNAGLAPYFRDMIRRDMNAKKPHKADYQNIEDYSADSLRWRDDPFYGWLNKNKKSNGEPYNIDKDGLRIYTTINAGMQKIAEDAVAEYLGGTLQPGFNAELKYKRNPPFTNDIDQEVVNMLMNQARKWSDRYRLQKKAGVSETEIMAQFKHKEKMRVFAWNKAGYVDTLMTPDDSIRYYKSIIRAGFVAIEPTTGYVKAYVGGPNYRYFKYDNVRQGKRQVGSTIKPFLYTLAMQSGMTPCDKVVNLPQSFSLFDGTIWTPRSTDKEEWIGQTVTLKWGLANSSNNISAYLMKQLGPAAMAQMMHRMGISSHLDEVYSLCVGPADISLFEMVSAYNTFPSRGMYVTPIYVTRIEDNQGNVLGDFSNTKSEAISESAAFLMQNMMMGVINQGTGMRLRSVYGLKGDIAGKTGTTNDNSDCWFIGYTPQLTAGVWVGYEDRQVHFDSMYFGQGAHAALPIWGIFMKRCMAEGLVDEETFVAPPGCQVNLECESAGSFLSGNTSGEHNEEEDYFFN